jgi:hypothetical protein
MAGDRHAVEPKAVEQREEVGLVVLVAVRVPVRAQAVPAQVERDDTKAVEERPDATPVAEVTREAVEEDDGPPVSSRVGICEPFRGRESTARAPAPIG